MPDDKNGSRLSGAEFTRGQLGELERAEVLASFGGQGLITEVLGIIGDGKEATVYCCAAHPKTGVELLAAKVYRAQKFRAFSGVSRYARERTPLGTRGRRAVRNRTRTGRRIAHGEWVHWEWETLEELCDAGASVPEPLAVSEDAILMEYLGDRDGPAPKLCHTRLGPEQMRGVGETLARDIEILLDCNRVHADLSAYNVLWWDDRAWMIDVPQSIDARTHPEAFALLCRDLENVADYLRAADIEPARLGRELWSRFVRHELGR